MGKMISNNINAKTDRRKQVIHLAVEILAAVAVALLLEFAFNYHALTEGYSSITIMDIAPSTEETAIYQSEFAEPIYMKKLILHGTAKKKSAYNISLVTINDFGAEEVLEIKDYMFKELKSAFTNINKKVKQIQITLTDPSEIQLTGISCSNEFSLNKYRIFFNVLVVFLVLLILFEKKLIVKKTWVFYMIAALGFGSLISVMAGPYAVTWDEEAHYSVVHNASFSSQVSANSAVKKSFSRKGWYAVNTAEESYLLKRYLNKKAESGDYVYNSTGSLKNYISYFPMILAYHFGEKIGLSYANAYILGRLGNLVFCVLLNILAIILARRKKVLIAVIGMMPTVIFQSSMYTYDGICFSFITLGTVLCVNEIEMEKGKENLLNILFSAVLFGCGCIIKPVYFPVFLLLLPVIWRRLNVRLNTKMKKRIGTGILCFLCLVMVGILVMKFQPLVRNMIEGNLSYGGDTRGGNTGMAGQILSMIHHPIAALKMFIRDICALDNFRNFGDGAENTILICNQMFLNLYVLGTLKEVWALILLPLLLLIFLVKPQGEPESFQNIKIFRKTCIAGVVLSVILIWLAMYLAFTPIGAGSIKGVQTRYYLPLVLPFAYAVWNNKINVRISKLRYYQIALGSGLLLCSACIYQYIIFGKAL